MQKRLHYVNRSFCTTHTSSRILLSVLPSRITVIPSALATTNVGTPSEKKKIGYSLVLFQAKYYRYLNHIIMSSCY